MDNTQNKNIGWNNTVEIKTKEKSRGNVLGLFDDTFESEISESHPTSETIEKKDLDSAATCLTGGGSLLFPKEPSVTIPVQVNEGSVKIQDLNQTIEYKVNTDNFVNEGPVSAQEFKQIKEDTDGGWFTIKNQSLGEATNFLGNMAAVTGENVLKSIGTGVSEGLDASKDLAKTIFGPSAAEQKQALENQKPEVLEKKNKEILALRQANEIIARETQRASQQEREEAVNEAIRILGKPMDQEDVKKLNLSEISVDKVMDTYHIQRLREWQRQQEIEAEKAKDVASLPQPTGKAPAGSAAGSDQSRDYENRNMQQAG
ncbi:MAG: hypothetical protein V1808_04650 [Candidatus Daviesbacteria bacterium]